MVLEGGGGRERRLWTWWRLGFFLVRSVWFFTLLFYSRARNFAFVDLDYVARATSNGEVVRVTHLYIFFKECENGNLHNQSVKFVIANIHVC